MSIPLKVIAWEWRDGSVHLEMPLVSFHVDDVIGTHLDGRPGRFETACGLQWFGVASSSGIGHSQRIDCDKCRAILRSATFTVEAPDSVVVES